MRLLPSRAWFALFPLAGGIGLVAYIVAKFSLLLGITLALAVGALAAWIVWRQTPAALRSIIKRRALIGALSGAMATLGYDLTRLVLGKVLGFTFWPFDVFPIFGRLLLGVHSPNWIAWVGGLLFHYCNGIGFAVTFVFLFRRPGVLSGLIWAGILEILMVALYPSWLGVNPMGEFLSISILGHATYGVLLGAFARYGLEQQMNLYTFRLSQL
jgi:hypothetical protein